MVWINNLDPFMPHICLFAVRHIKVNEELTFDYKINGKFKAIIHLVKQFWFQSTALQMPTKAKMLVRTRPSIRMRTLAVMGLDQLVSQNLECHVVVEQIIAANFFIDLIYLTNDSIILFCIYFKFNIKHNFIHNLLY